MSEHVILVAFTVEAPSRENAQRLLFEELPTPGRPITSWWVAEDDRIDGSDNDSAVFCDRLRQGDAQKVLIDFDMSIASNAR